MSVIRQAPEPEVVPHYCSDCWLNLPVGSVTRCDECGQYWYRGRAWDDGNEYNPWLKVRWWHFRERRIIRAADGV